ncbi:MAG: small basic protein [Planctomycetes bacterium]|nr:small basic protein [Planctomycetota bacterium]
MSLDKSLKSKSALARHRNVLTRAERIDRLKDEVRWEEGTSPFGLPKIVNRKVSAGTKEKKVKEGDDADAAAGGSDTTPAGDAGAAKT